MLPGRQEESFPVPGAPGAGPVGPPLIPAPKASELEPPPPAPEATGAGPAGFPLIPAPKAPELEEDPPPHPAASGVKKFKHSDDELLIKHACEFELVAHPWVVLLRLLSCIIYMLLQSLQVPSIL